MATTNPSRSPRRRRSPWLRRLVVVVLLVGAVLMGLRTDDASRIAARALERAAEALTGEQVTIGQVRLSYLPIVVEIDAIAAIHPATGDTFASVDAVRITPGFDGPRLVLRRLTLDHPMVDLHVDKDGLRELRGLPTGGSSSPSTGPASLPWKELVIEGGKVTVHGPAWAVDVAGIDLHPRPEDPSRADLGIDRLSVDGAATPQVAENIELPNVRLDPSDLEIPSLNLQLPGVGVDGHLSLPAEGPLVGDVSVRVNLASLTAAPLPPPDTGAALPWTDGAIALDATLGGTRADPTVSGALAVAGLTLWQRGSHGEAHAVTFGDLQGPWHLVTTPGVEGPTHQLSVDHATMVWGPGTLYVEALAGIETPTVIATVGAEGVSLANILRDVGVAPTPWVDFTADVETSVTGSYAPFRLDGPFEIDLTKLEVGDAPVGGPHDTLLAVPRGSLGGDLVITADHMILDARNLRAGPTHGRALADIGFAQTGPLSVDIDIPELDLSWLAPLGDLGLDGLAAVHGRLGGPYTALGAEGTVDAAGFVVLGLPIADRLTAHFTTDMRRLDFDQVVATLGDTRYEGAYGIDFTKDNWMETGLTVTSGRLRDLTGIFTDLGDVDSAVTGTLALTGTPYDLTGETRFALTDVNVYGEHFPTGDADAWMTHGELTLDHLTLTRPGPRAAPSTLTARGSVKRGWAMNVEVLSDNFDLDRMDLLASTGLPIQGALSLDAHLGGTVFDWRPDGRLALRHARYGGESLGDTVLTFDTVDLAPGDPGLAWRGSAFGAAARLAGTLGFYGLQPYTLQAELHDFPLQFFHPRAQDGNPITATVTGSLDLRGRFGDSPTPVDIEGNLSSVALAWNEHSLWNPAPWRFSVHQKSVDIPRLELAGNDGTTLWLTGTFGSDKRVKLNGGGQLNLDLVRAAAPGITEARGSSDLRFSMQRAADGSPDIQVEATLTDAFLRTEYYPDPFEGLAGRIHADANAYTFSDVTATVGGGSFVGADSRIDAKGWLPVRYALKASLTDTRVKYFDYLPPMEGDAVLAFDGPASDGLLSGEITLREMDFKDRIDWEAMVISLREERLTASAPEESERYFSMDIGVKSDQTVHLRNNVADADASADLRVIGDTARPGMTGTVRVTSGGRAFLHEREFEMTRGELRYLDPYTFDPDLNFLLETDVRSQDQDYHVTYAITGPFSDWRTTTTSDPYLAQADINALLLFGVTRDELDQNGGRSLGNALVAETGDLLLGQTALSKANLLVDRWSLVSGVNERGSTTVSSDLRFVAEKQVGDFDITVETSLGQSLGQDWYASVERRIAQRLYATTYIATQQEGRSLPIGAAYGAEFKFRWDAD